MLIHKIVACPPPAPINGGGSADVGGHHSYWLYALGLEPEPTGC